MAAFVRSVATYNLIEPVHDIYLAPLGQPFPMLLRPLQGLYSSTGNNNRLGCVVPYNEQGRS